MVFKLIRTDAENPCKIQLPVGTHLLGRGKFLDCDDKRISRSHSELQVTDDTVVIKSLHQNPCFFITKGSDETQILKQNCTQNLCNGDKFGLLPSSHWYEILHCTFEEISPVSTTANVTEKDRAYDENTECIGDVDDRVTVTSNDTDTNETGVNNVRNLSQCDGVRDDSPDSPSLLANQETETRSPVSEESPSNSKSPKRCHSPQINYVKRVKNEPQVKQELPDTQPGPSNDAGPSSSCNGAACPPSPVKPTNAPIGRERCFYGANCYRRNPAHKLTFSHPSDSDWGPGARGVCPRGAACASRQPRHWTTHTHPPGLQPPPPTPAMPGMRVVQRHGNVFYINAHSVNFYEDRFQVEDSDGDSVDFDYEF